MALPEILSILLRLAELVFAAIVAGLTGAYLHAARGASAMSLARFIYVEVVAALSILFALVWLLPFSGSFISWPGDLFFSVLWFVGFGLLVDWLGGSCGGVFEWDGIGFGGGPGGCTRLKADLAFVFLSGVVWLVSALVGIYWVRKHTRRAPVVTTTHRRRWYRSRV